MPDLHPPLSSGQEALAHFKLLQSSAVDFLFLVPVRLPPQSLWCQAGMACMGVQGAPRASPAASSNPVFRSALQVDSAPGKVKNFFHKVDLHFPLCGCVFGGRGSPFPPSAVWTLTVFGVSPRSCRSSLLL